MKKRIVLCPLLLLCSCSQKEQTIAQMSAVGSALATYEAEGPSMNHLAGHAISGGWRIAVSDSHDTFATFGPYTADLPIGPQVARFHLRVDNNSADDAAICRIDVHDATASTVLVSRTLNRREFQQPNQYQGFDLIFDNPGGGHRLEFRTYYIWYAGLDQDKVVIHDSGITPPPPPPPPPGSAIAIYQAEEEPMQHLTGRAISGGWRVGVQDPHETYATYGPYASDLPAGGLRARFHLRVDNNSADDAAIARIEVFDAAAQTLLASQTLTRSMWIQPNTYQPFELAFTNPGGHPLEFRTYYHWYGQLDQDRVEIFASGTTPPTDPLDAVFVSQQVPSAVSAGQAFEARITMRNTGSTAWTEQQMHRLGYGGPGFGADNTWGANRMQVDSGLVAPGAEYTFVRLLTAPTTTGSYRFQWQMLVEATSDPWFGALTDEVMVAVRCADGATRYVTCPADPIQTQRQVCSSGSWSNDGPCFAVGQQYGANPFVFPVTTLSRPYQDWPPRGMASLILGYLDGDQEIDFVIVGETGISAYDHYGVELWTMARASTYNQRTDGDVGTLLGYHSTAGVIGNNAFYFIAADQHTLVEVDGATGVIRRQIPVGPMDWTDVGLGHVFAPSGPEDIILLQDGYIGGNTGYRNTNKVGVIASGESSIAWTFETQHHEGIAFAHMRVADVDGDGLDEVCPGRVCIDNDGVTVLMRFSDPVWGTSPQRSYTTLQVLDLFPNNPGLEAFIGHYFIGWYGVHSFAFGLGNFAQTWQSGSNVHSATVGNFDLRPHWTGPEALIRSNKDGSNNPPDVRYLRFLNFASGEEVVHNVVPENSWMNDVDDNGWSLRGSYPRFIDWDGDAQMEVALVERHTRYPRVSVNAPRSGARLLETTDRGNGEGTARIFDVSGDGREEVVVWNANSIAVYWSATGSPAPLKRTSRAYLLRSRHGSFVYNYPQ